MDKTEFFYKYTIASANIDFDERIKIEKESVDPNPIDVGPGNRNLIIVMEECSELTQELIKMNMGLGDRLSLIEETADTEQGLDYVKFLCNINSDDVKLPEFDFQKKENMIEADINPIIALGTLQQQISKYLRGKPNKTALTEAVKNVYIALDMVKYSYNIHESEINKAMNVKLQRLVDTKKNDSTRIYQ